MRRCVFAAGRIAPQSEVRLFEFTDRGRARDADPDPAALTGIQASWRALVGRDRRPIGVRLALQRTGPDAALPEMSALLDGVLDGLTFESDGQPQFPHGLIVLAPQDLDADAAMSGWRAPRNVLLELGQRELEDEQLLRRMFEIQKQGARIALRLDEPVAPPSERLPYFQYLVAPSHRQLPAGIDPRTASVLTLDAGSYQDVEAGFAAGVYATAGWPMSALPQAEPRGLTPAQTAVFELIRLVQSDADLRDLERVFKGEPLLAYLLLTLANSAAFRRPTPVSSIGHAISLLGYQRLTKWLVLLLAIAGKDRGSAPLVFAAVVRAHLLENLYGAAGRTRVERDDAFVIGMFSLLDAITGQSMHDLLQGIHLGEPITASLLGGVGPCAPLLEIARAFEAADPLALTLARTELGLDPAHANRALLRALAAADSLQSLIQ